MRQHKYQRAKINGNDVKVDSDNHIVFEKHHESIIADSVFLYAQEQLKLRTTTNYRGVKNMILPTQDSYIAEIVESICFL